jgi:hypothetical protein
VCISSTSLQDPHPADRALVAAATRLEEAWAWGLDPDMWRAHLGPMTWPGETGSRVWMRLGLNIGCQSGLWLGCERYAQHVAAAAAPLQAETLSSLWLGLSATGCHFCCALCQHHQVLPPLHLLLLKVLTTL